MPFVLELENFQGPFDLLLKLLDQQKLEITEISLAKITDDYLDYITKIDLSIEEMNSFLFIAAKLSLDKSRAIISSGAIDDELDIDLASSLKQYQIIKGRAKVLDELSKSPMTGRKNNLYKITSTARIDPAQLNEVFINIQNTRSHKPETHQIKSKKDYVKTTKDKFNNHIAKLKSFSMTEIMSKPQNRTEAIIFFLSILEMLKAEKINEQAGVFVGVQK
jgi:segregation and condensation protein A